MIWLKFIARQFVTTPNIKIHNFLYLVCTFIFITCSQKSKWAGINSDFCPFSIEFPNDPIKSSNTSVVEYGKVTFNFYYYEPQNKDDDNLSYMAGCIFWPDSILNLMSIDNFFQTAIKRSAESVFGTVISNKEIFYNEFPGREVKMKTESLGDSFIKLRVYLINNIQYILLITMNINKDYNYSEYKFFNSFKIKPLTK